MRGLVLAIVALLLVSGDAGRYPPQLFLNAVHVLSATDYTAKAHSSKGAASSAGLLSSTEQATNATFLSSNTALPLLWLATLQGFQPAEDLLTETARQQAALYWLERLVERDNAAAAWALYQLLGEDEASERFVQLAAKGNVPEAQLTFAMASDDPRVRQTWLERAAKLGHKPAQAALADWYLLQGQQEKAKPWFAKVADSNMQSAFKYGRLLWDENQRKQAKNYFKKAANGGHIQARELISVLNRYSPVTPSGVSGFSWPSEKVCHQRIQFFATSLSTITRANTLYQQYRKDSRLKPLSLCIAPPIWLENDSLDCSDNYNGSNRLGCDIKPLASVVEKRQLTHAIVVSEQGKASVQNGVMFLDISDDYSVFVHELAHFAGFIDEYPLTRSAAKRYCQPANISSFSPPNLVLDGQLSYHPIKTVALWERALTEAQQVTSSTRPLVVGRAKTCEAIQQRAYKPSVVVTFMEHHDIGVIPPIYLQLWQAQLANPEAQRPISMNLFQAFHQQGNTDSAGQWLDIYERGFAQPTPQD